MLLEHIYLFYGAEERREIVVVCHNFDVPRDCGRLKQRRESLIGKVSGRGIKNSIRMK